MQEGIHLERLCLHHHSLPVHPELQAGARVSSGSLEPQEGLCLNKVCWDLEPRWGKPWAVCRLRNRRAAVPERCVHSKSDEEKEPQPHKGLLCDVGASHTAGAWRPAGEALVAQVWCPCPPRLSDGHYSCNQHPQAQRRVGGQPASAEASDWA